MSNSNQKAENADAELFKQMFRTAVRRGDRDEKYPRSAMLRRVVEYKTALNPEMEHIGGCEVQMRFSRCDANGADVMFLMDTISEELPFMSFELVESDEENWETDEIVVTVDDVL